MWTTIGGDGIKAYSEFNLGRFSKPTGVAVGSDGAVHVIDFDIGMVRKLSDGVWSTNGQITGGDEGIDAAFSGPVGVAVDSAGALYVTDWKIHRIRKHTGGVWSTIGGSSTAGFSNTGTGQFDRPYGVAVGSDGAVYVGDQDNHAIRKLSGGVWSTDHRGRWIFWIH